MAFVLPEGLSPEAYPLAWLVGTWHGDGALGYPGIDQSAITQDITFTHDGGPYLAYRCETRLVTAQGTVGQVWHTESGFWRVVPQDPAFPPSGHPAFPEGKSQGPGSSSPASPASQSSPSRAIEVLVADPAGSVSVYVGDIAGPRVNLATDLMAHTPSGADMSAASRMYGLVEGDLLWAWDLAAFGQPLQSYMSARLHRVEQTSA